MKQTYILLTATVVTFILMFALPAKPYNNLGSGGKKIGWPVRISVETQNNFGQSAPSSQILKYLLAFALNFAIVLVVVEIALWVLRKVL